MNKDKIFSEGIYFNRPRENAPAFVKGSVSVKVEPFVAFVQKHINVSGYVNLTLKESQGGKLYFELDTWTKTLETAKAESVKAGVETKQVVEEANPDDLPF